MKLAKNIRRFGATLRITMFASVVGLAGAQTAIAEEIVLRAVTYASPNAYDESLTVFKEYIKRVNERGADRLRIDYVGGPEVVGVRDQMGALRSGVVDMIVTFTAHESLVPEVGTVGLSRITPAEEREVGYFDVMDAAHARVGVRPIGRVSTNSGFHIFSSTKIASLEDFEGLRIRSHAGYDAFFQSLGANPIHMQISEIYPALERGLIDAAPYTLFVHSLGVQEVAEFAVDEAFWPSHTTWTYINADKLAWLPEDLQELLYDVQIELEGDMTAIIDEMKLEERRKLEAAGLEFVPLAEDDRQTFLNLADESRWKALENTLDEDTLSEIRNMIAPDL